MQPKQSAYVLLVVISAMSAPTAWSAEACAPPPGFVDTPHPELAPIEALLSHTEENTIDQPFHIVVESASRASLEDTIDRTSGLPGVVGTYRLTQGKFGPGTRRLVCLSDGSTVVEQVLIQEQSAGTARFRYVVWNYTSPKFPPISYAIGEFQRTALGDSRTHVRWTYSFQPNREKYPASAGSHGDAWFRESFLESRFTQWMRKTMANGKKKVDEYAASRTP